MIEFRNESSKNEKRLAYLHSGQNYAQARFLFGFSRKPENALLSDGERTLHTSSRRVKTRVSETLFSSCGKGSENELSANFPSAVHYDFLRDDEERYSEGHESRYR